MPLIATKGAASAQGFGEFAQSAAPNYIEQVFQTWLYTGNGSSQTITNGIDLSTKGGLVWTKDRGQAIGHRQVDTVTGAEKILSSSSTAAQVSGTGYGITSFGSTGYTITDTYGGFNSGSTYVSWTFRKQPKFFDVVTYTGNGTQPRTITHNLGSVPGCIIVKRTDSTSDWAVYHRAVDATTPQGYRLELNTTNARVATTSTWNDQAPTSTEFYIGSATYNANGGTYVAYLFAHNAGGFGLTGSDNVISCGSVTANGSGAVAETNLGWEPQWVLYKRTDSTSNWFLFDTMRGLVTGTDPTSTNNKALYPNLSDAEINSGSLFQPLATGFAAETAAANSTWIYIAIRRGPMKTPTTGTSVFTPDAAGNNASAGGLAFDAGFPVDWYVRGEKSGSNKFYGFTRLTGNEYLETTSTAAGATSSFADQFDSMTGIETTTGFDFSGQCAWLFRRSPGFFDVVCYTGTGSARTVSHNLGVVPEMMIVKSRNGADSWIVYHSTLGATKYVLIDGTGAAVTDSTMWNNTAPTASVFSLGASPGTATNLSGTTYVAYLFATVAGVSKVGSYTGTGALLTVDCGFTGGARFVMIRRTSTGGGDWWVYDSARGISSGNDPYLFLNSTAAEVTNTNYVDTTSVGFQVTAAAPAGLNANGGTFIFLAVA